MRRRFTLKQPSLFLNQLAAQPSIRQVPESSTDIPAASLVSVGFSCFSSEIANQITTSSVCIFESLDKPYTKHIIYNRCTICAV